MPKDWNQTLHEAHDNYTIKVTIVGNVTYIGKALTGITEDQPFWQCKKIDETSGIKITWADGDDKFDNVATDLTALSYS